MATRDSDGGGDDTQSGSQLQSQEVILAQMASFMEGLKEFKNEMVEQQEEVVRIASKRARQHESTTLKRAGNVAQMAFVEEVIEHVKEAAWQIEGMEGPKAAAAVRELMEAEAMLNRRIRLIKIADRSEHGWATVREYESDKLAIDSEDEKRLMRAEKEAQKKAARTKLKPADASSGHGTVRLDPPGGSSAGRPAKVIGPCFECGLMGHLRRYCPKGATRSPAMDVSGGEH